MKLITTIAVLLPTTIMASPSALTARAGDELCAPTLYTLSNYVLVTSDASAYLSFNFKSEFPSGTPAQDPVQSGFVCDAVGPVIPNNNVCNINGVKNRELLFDLRAPQDQSHYQITHTWACNGATWMSGNNVKVLTKCEETSTGSHECVGEPLQLAPQNVRKVCQSPRC